MAFKYGGLAPDSTTTYNYNSSGSSGGGYDYTKLLRGLMGGGGGGAGRPSIGGTGGFSRGGSAVLNNLNSIHARLPGGTGPSIPVMDVQSAAQFRNAQAALPYQMQAEAAAAQQAGQMDIARLNSGTTLAQTQMQMELQRQIEMQRIEDNEKNRQHQAELARRAQLGDAYQTRLSNYYQYGLGE